MTNESVARVKLGLLLLPFAGLSCALGSLSWSFGTKAILASSVSLVPSSSDVFCRFSRDLPVSMVSRFPKIGIEPEKVGNLDRKMEVLSFGTKKGRIVWNDILVESLQKICFRSKTHYRSFSLSVFRPIRMFLVRQIPNSEHSSQNSS